LHHNVDYDTHSFFNNCVMPTTPEKTVQSGLAVCEGYAGLFAALALKAGLEAMVCSGACKGYGHAPLEPGQAIPPYESTHAWNVVKIDNGEWKLIDPCWGAGHLGCQLRNEGYVSTVPGSTLQRLLNSLDSKNMLRGALGYTIMIFS
jgi:transglutaminase/protease-like cytokinesis protein 3